MSQLSPPRKMRREDGGMEVEVPDGHDPTGGLAPRQMQQEAEGVDALPQWFGQLKSELLEGMGGIVEQKLAPIQQEIQSVKSNVGELKNKVMVIEGVANDAKQLAESVKSELASMIVFVGASSQKRRPTATCTSETLT